MARQLQNSLARKFNTAGATGGQDENVYFTEWCPSFQVNSGLKFSTEQVSRLHGSSWIQIKEKQNDSHFFSP